MLQPYAEHRNLNRDQLLEVVAARDESIKIGKVESIRLSEFNRKTVRLGDNPTPQPIDVVAKYLKAPASFLQSADFELAQHIVDHQFPKVSKKRAMVYRNGLAVGDQPTESIHLNGSQIVEKILANVGDYRAANFYDLGANVDLTIVGEKITLKPKLNDITEGGVRICYSEIMAWAPSIEPYVERLVCTNGMIMKSFMQGFQFDTLDEFLLQLEGAVVKSLNYVDNTVRKQLEKAAESKVERSEQAVRHIFGTNNLSTRMLPDAIAALTVEDDGTAFGVLQAITRAANGVNYVRRNSLQSVAASEMARLEKVHCPTCWSEMVH